MPLGNEGVLPQYPLKETGAHAVAPCLQQEVGRASMAARCFCLESG